jgi:adenylate kinase family enzyme
MTGTGRGANGRGRREAVLLVGPTGAGKTPLGDALERRGLLGRRCVHFDFGRNLRAVAEGDDFGLSSDERDHVRRVLGEGLLLENNRFGIALKILSVFIERRRMESGDLLVMNGLPRHKGQAAAVDAVLNVALVVLLDAAPDVLLDRIRLNSGGDRAGRTDDSPAEVANKIAIFEARTAPLLDRYESGGVRVARIEVRAGTTADEALDRLEVMLGENADAHQS